MSRIIVKNLPLNADEQKIRDLFKAKGTITDVKLMRRKDGSSRRFAFVGFKTNQQAKDSATYFNDSFMTTAKIQVEVAKELYDSSLVSSYERKKRRRDAEEAQEIEKSKKEKKLDEASKDDKFAEYLDAMKPQSSTAIWKNDLKPADATVASVPQEGDDDDEEEIVDMTSSKQNGSDEEMQMENEEDHTDAELEKMRGNNDNINDEEEDKEAKDQGVSDMDWLMSRRTRIKEQVPDVDEEEPTKEEVIVQPKKVKSATKPVAAPTPVESTGPSEEDKILESGRLFLRNLSYSTTEDELVDLFNGKASIHLPVDPKTDKPKGIAFATFKHPDEALEAYNALDGSGFQGRLLHILAAKPPQKYELDEFDLKNMPLKKQQLLKKKANAAKQQFSWNSLYLNRDAVLETVAKKLGVTKSEMLDPHSSNMAVKAALAESTVLESVQTYFKSKGVDLAKLETKDTTDKIILVKNIPFGTSLEELSDLFGAYGELVRVLMPPDGGIAIVQFMNAGAGRSAFSKLAFRRLGNSVLYLQKAPKGILEDSTTSEVEKKEKTKAVSAQDLLSVDQNEAAISAAVHASVFVKNLSFNTTTQELSNLFKNSPGFATASIKTKPDPKDSTKIQSMGYGFVEFDSLEHAETAIRALQGYKLDGHDLQLKLSTRGKEASTRKASTSKIVIKNIPFETTRQDIYDLLGTFGQLLSVRVPKKFNKQTRGFAFAEFATVKEAETAMASLTGAHLLGRRLIMQFAEADALDAEEEIARMEKKVQGQVNAEQLASMRVTGQAKAFDMDEPEE